MLVFQAPVKESRRVSVSVLVLTLQIYYSFGLSSLFSLIYSLRTSELGFSMECYPSSWEQGLGHCPDSKRVYYLRRVSALLDTLLAGYSVL